MELHREELSVEAFAESVDLERLFVEFIETFVLESTSWKIDGLYHTPAVGQKILVNIRTLGFAGLSEGRWRSVVGFDGPNQPTILEHIESLIRVFGRHCKIDSPQDLVMISEAFRIIAPEASTDALLQMLAETAVNQALDKSGIGMVEQRPVRSQIDVDLLRESQQIVQLVRTKINRFIAPS